jgi:RnfABCDGE-type electron transport complex D subunit
LLWQIERKINKRGELKVNENYNISASPHIRDKATSSNLMLMVLIALLPATIFGIYNFRHENAWLLVVVTTAVAVLSEYIYQKLMHKPVTIKDFSAAVTGLLLALNLPPTLPLWMGALGSIFAVIVVKQLFGGLGQNFMNPALAARCFLLISFTGRMTYFVYDGVTGATPLANLKAGETVDTMTMLLGNIRGTIGETSVLAIMIGAMFLLLMGVIDLRIPGTYIVTFVVFITIFGGHGFDAQYITAHLCGGGLMLGAWFMATDYVTSPITFRGQIVYGVCLGLLTGLFRLFGGSAEGVSYAIIISNLLVPLIEKVTLPKPFGKGGEK